MRSDEEVLFGFVVIAAIGAFVIFLIYTCCTYLFGEDRGSTGGYYSSSSVQSYARSESSSDPLNLHGYGRDSALTMLKQYLENKKRAGRYSATVITGRGQHSPFQRPVLRPAVIDWLDNRGYRYDASVGDIKVYL